MVPQERRAELHKRFRAAPALQDFDVDDIPAARGYIAAYVSFFTYAEGEDHEHHGPAGHGSTGHDSRHEHWDVGMRRVVKVAGQSMAHAHGSFDLLLT